MSDRSFMESLAIKTNNLSAGRWKFLVALAVGILLITTSSFPLSAKRKRRRPKASKIIKSPDAQSLQQEAQGALPFSLPSSASIDTKAVMAHARHITEVIGPRPANSEKAKEAQSYLRAVLSSIGLEVQEKVVGQSSAPAISIASIFSMPALIRDIQDSNLWVDIPGKGGRGEGAILFIAHYDSVPTSPGAVDNAVSMAILLELARVLKLTPSHRDIRIAFTAAEEIRLLGAESMAEELVVASETPPTSATKRQFSVALVVALDLIGSKGTLTLNGLSDQIGRGWLNWLAAVARKAKIAINAPWPQRVVSILFPELERSDHGAFSRRGVAAIHLYTRGEDPIYLAYHSPLDSMKEVDSRAVTDASAMVLAMSQSLYSLPKDGGDLGIWLALPGGVRVPASWAGKALMYMLLLFVLMSIVRKPAHNDEDRDDSGKIGILPCLLVLLGSATAAWLLSAVLYSHRFVWSHAPRLHSVAWTVLMGGLFLALFATLTRLKGNAGQKRFLFPALVYLSLFGFFLLALELVELAWLFLWPAACLGAMRRVQKLRSAIIALVLSLIPLLPLLSNGLLRESVFHGFFPPLPLPLFLLLLLWPYFLGLSYLSARWQWKPSRNLALTIGGIAIALGLILVLAAPTPCTATKFKQWSGLRCEVAP